MEGLSHKGSSGSKGISMNSDDNLVLSYLGKFPLAYVSAMEVCKRAADRKRFAAEPDWAKPVLVTLTQQHVLECNAMGQYRIKPPEEEEKHRKAYVPRPDATPEPAPEVKAATPAEAPKAPDATPPEAPKAPAQLALPLPNSPEAQKKAA